MMRIIELIYTECKNSNTVKLHVANPEVNKPQASAAVKSNVVNDVPSPHPVPRAAHACSLPSAVRELVVRRRLTRESALQLTPSEHHALQLERELSPQRYNLLLGGQVSVAQVLMEHFGRGAGLYSVRNSDFRPSVVCQREHGRLLATTGLFAASCAESLLGREQKRLSGAECDLESRDPDRCRALVIRGQQ